MTDDLLQLAREVGLVNDHNARATLYARRLARFAALIEQRTIERCAKVCDPYTHGQWFAKAIRALGAK